MPTVMLDRVSKSADFLFTKIGQLVNNSKLYHIKQNSLLGLLINYMLSIIKCNLTLFKSYNTLGSTSTAVSLSNVIVNH